MRQVQVQLGDRSYTIHIGEAILVDLVQAMEALDLGRTVALITDPRLVSLYAEHLLECFREQGWRPLLYTFPAGERYKTLRTVSRLWDRLIRDRLERRDPLVALGGGVVGDVVGFVAATYLRGVPYIQVPTTLLAQVDSSVGGKTAVDHPLGKNLIGAFYQPYLVWTDVKTLETLPLREYRAGLAEVVKYGVIADAAFFAFLEARIPALLARDPSVLIPVVARCCEIKAQVVSQDEREAGLRAILNFGHTFAHALEALGRYRDWLHGEAVAVGMVVAARMAHLLGICPEEVPRRIRSLLEGLGLPVSPPSDLSLDRLSPLLFRDKKVQQGRIRWVLPEVLGRVRILPLEDLSPLQKVLQSC